MHPILKRLMLTALIILGTLYVFLIILALRSDRMIFQPQSASYHEADTPYEWIHLVSIDNSASPRHRFANISAFHVPALGAGGDEIEHMHRVKHPAPRFTLLMSHGNAEDIGQNYHLYLEYAARGFSVFAYDYRGYGTSTGTPTESGVNADELAAWNYLTHQLKIPPNNIILHGTSVGCGPAVELAAQLSSLPEDQRPAALILQSPFRSAFTVLTRIPLVPWDKFNNARRIRQVHVPVLVIHGRADQVIPFSHGQKVFHNASPEGDADAPLTRTSGKQHLWIPNAGHNDIFILNSQTYFQKIQSFTAQLPQQIR